MPTLTKTLSDFSLKSEWVLFPGATTSEGTISKTFNLSAIPDGSTINSATLTGNVRSQFYTGRFRAIYNSSKTLKSAAGTTAEFFNVDVLSWFSGMNTFGDFSVTFAFKETDVHGDVWQGYGYFIGITLTITYTLPYTAVTAPTTVSLSVPNTHPGQTTVLSWSGAKAGTNNAITGYEVHRSTTTKTGTYTRIATTDASTKKYTITAPSSNVTYYYKVKTLGTVSGYDSAVSSAVATMSMTSTAAVAPTTVSVSPSGPYPTQSVTISWSGARAGTNNPITGYQVYRATSSSGTYSLIATIDRTQTSGSTTDTAPTSGSRYYKVKTVGTYIDSGQSSAIGSFTVDGSGTSDFTLPSSVTVGTAFSLTISTNTNKAHTLSLSMGSGSNTWSQSYSIAANTASYSITIPLSALTTMPNSATSTLTAVLTTSGAGTYTKTTTARAPSSAGPSVPAATIAPVSTVVPSSWNKYIAGCSAASVTLSTACTAQYGATIVSYSISGNGISETDSVLPLTGTSASLSAGSKSFTVTAKDSRGLTSKQTLTVSVVAYSKPTISSVTVYRCNASREDDDEGTYIFGSVKPTFSSCGGSNSITVVMKWKLAGASSYASQTNMTAASGVYSARSSAVGANKYNVQIVVTDALGNTTSTTQDVQRISWEFHVKRGGGAWAFGGVADTAGTLHVYGAEKLDGNLIIAKDSPSVYLRKSTAATENTGGMQVLVQDSNNRLILFQRVDGSSPERYRLPVPTTHDETTNYAILTSKDAVTVAQGGTGATTAAAARTNLGLGSVLSDLSGLQNALGSTAFVYKQIPASSSASFTFSSNCSYAVLISGVSATTRCLIFGYCNTSGTVSQTKMDAGSSTNITVTTDTYKLTIANAYTSAAYALLIKINGTAPT